MPPADSASPATNPPQRLRCVDGVSHGRGSDAADRDPVPMSAARKQEHDRRQPGTGLPGAPRISPARGHRRCSERLPFIVLDCPPALDLLTLNALVAADGLLVPMQAEYFALEGITELMQTLDRVAQAFNPTLALEGVLLTMYDDRTNLSQQVTENLQAFLRREAADHHHSAQHPPGRSSQPRQAGPTLRPEVEGRGSLYGARTRITSAEWYREPQGQGQAVSKRSRESAEPKRGTEFWPYNEVIWKTNDRDSDPFGFAQGRLLRVRMTIELSRQKEGTMEAIATHTSHDPSAAMRSAKGSNRCLARGRRPCAAVGRSYGQATGNRGRPNRTQSQPDPHRLRPGQAGGTGAVDCGHGRGAADCGARAARRALSADHGRAALARLPGRGQGDDSRHRPRRSPTNRRWR